MFRYAKVITRDWAVQNSFTFNKTSIVLQPVEHVGHFLALSLKKGLSETAKVEGESPVMRQRSRIVSAKMAIDFFAHKTSLLSTTPHVRLRVRQQTAASLIKVGLYVLPPIPLDPTL